VGFLRSLNSQFVFCGHAPHIFSLVAPLEALFVLHWAMHAALHWRILMAIETASKPHVFLYSSTIITLQ
jgi:hypothetical protein